MVSLPPTALKALPFRCGQRMLHSAEPSPCCTVPCLHRTLCGNGCRGSRAERVLWFSVLRCVATCCFRSTAKVPELLKEFTIDFGLSIEASKSGISPHAHGPAWMGQVTGAVLDLPLAPVQYTGRVETARAHCSGRWKPGEVSYLRSCCTVVLHRVALCFCCDAPGCAVLQCRPEEVVSFSPRASSQP